MKIQSTTWMRSAFCGFAGLAVAFSAAVVTAQEEEGRRRGRAEVQEGDAPEAGGPRGQRGGAGGQRGGAGGQRGGPGGPGGRGPGGPGGRGVGGPGGPGGPEMMMRLPIMAALDVDRDGVISAKEIEGAVAALKTLDKNKDGKLVFQELVPERGGPGGPGGEPGRGPRGFGPGGDRPGGPDQAGRGPGGFGGMDPKALVDRMMQADKDGDGVLSGDEIPERMARMLERGDSDGDGKLSREEIEKSMARMQRGGGRPDGGRPGAGRDSDTPGGERPRRPSAE